MCVVLKAGGSLGGTSLNALCDAVRAVRSSGRQTVLVHGGGPRITTALREAGIELPFVDGLRRTTPEAMPTIERVLGREVNAELVAALSARGERAIGMSGADSILWTATDESDRTGRITCVHVEPLRICMANGELPVIAPIGIDLCRHTYNVNADTAAAAIAIALGAERLVLLTDVAGVYRHFDTREQVFDTTPAELRQLLAAGRLQSGMVPKVQAMLDASAAGVRRVYVVDGRDPANVRWAAADGGQAFQADRREHGTRLWAEGVVSQ